MFFYLKAKILEQNDTVYFKGRKDCEINLKKKKKKKKKKSEIKECK